MIRKHPERLACVGASAYQTLSDLGCEGRIVAWTDDVHRPKRGPAPGFVIGPVHAPDMDALVDLAPDLVILDRYLCTPRVSEQLASGLPVFAMDPSSILDLKLEFEELGRVLGRIPEARSFSFALQAEELRIRTTHFGQAPLRILVPTDRSPWRVVGGAGFAAECLEICQAKSALHEGLRPEEFWVSGQLSRHDYDAVLLPSPSFTEEDAEVLAIAPELAQKPMRLIDERALFWRGTHTIVGLRDLDETLGSLREELQC